MKWFGIATGSAILLALGIIVYVVVVLSMVKPSGPAPQKAFCTCGHEWGRHTTGELCQQCSCDRFKMHSGGER